MTDRFIVRLLAADDTLLGWCAVWAQATPQATRVSCPFWPTQPTKFPITQDGVVTKLSIHWTALDIARVREVQPTEVKAGQVLLFTWMEPVWLVAGMRDVPLPGVTVCESVAVAPPTGAVIPKDSRL